jgi:hypothetical protein
MGARQQFQRFDPVIGMFESRGKAADRGRGITARKQDGLAQAMDHAPVVRERDAQGFGRLERRECGLIMNLVGGLRCRIAKLQVEATHKELRFTLVTLKRLGLLGKSLRPSQCRWQVYLRRFQL